MSLDLVELEQTGQLAKAKVEKKVSGHRNCSCHYYELAATCPFCGALNDHLFTKDFAPCEHFLYAETGGSRPKEVCFIDPSEEDQAAAIQVRNSLPIRFHFAPNLAHVPVLPLEAYHESDQIELKFGMGQADMPMLFCGPVFRTTSSLTIRFKMRYGWRISCRNVR